MRWDGFSGGELDEVVLGTDEQTREEADAGTGDGRGDQCAMTDPGPKLVFVP